MPVRSDLIVGPDGRSRCGWVGDDPEYRRYHDEEWGHPLRGDRALFEKLSLEAFQSGLSWITILRRRAGFRAAFAQFDPDTVAGFDETDVVRLLTDPRIIRNRAKIDATIANARIIAPWVRAEPGALDRLIWSHAPPTRTAPLRTADEVPASTAESAALAAELRALGLRFVGPVTVYALMQSAGLVDDHLSGCWRAVSS
jgi:DNA-3-methyladenine glycosylase I